MTTKKLIGKKVDNIEKKAQTSKSEKANALSSSQKNKKTAIKPSLQKPSKLRRQRVPLHIQKRTGLKDTEPDRHYHLVKDVGDRISRFLKAGYRIEKKQTEDQLRGTYSADQITEHAIQDMGNGVNGYHMSTELETWKKDQKDKQRENDRIMSLIGKSGVAEKDAAGAQSGKYTGELDINRTIVKESGKDIKQTSY